MHMQQLQETTMSRASLPQRRAAAAAASQRRHFSPSSQRRYFSSSRRRFPTLLSSPRRCFSPSRRGRLLFSMHVRHAVRELLRVTRGVLEDVWRDHVDGVLAEEGHQSNLGVERELRHPLLALAGGRAISAMYRKSHFERCTHMRCRSATSAACKRRRRLFMQRKLVVCQTAPNPWPKPPPSFAEASPKLVGGTRNVIETGQASALCITGPQMNQITRR